MRNKLTTNNKLSSPTRNCMVRLLELNTRFFRYIACFGQGKVQKYASYLPRIVARLLRTRQGKFELSTYGVWLTSNPSDRTYRMCLDGAYGPFYFDYVLRLPRCVYIDIGSNIGLYSLVAGRNPLITHIYSFEPNVEVCDYLMENLAFNGVGHGTAIPKAISSTTEKLVLKTYAGHTGKSSLRRNTDQDPPDGEIIIETVNHNFIDELLKENTTPIALKIDVEGHEEVVIQTLQKSKQWNNIFSIFFEVDERYIDVTKIIAILDSNGFTLKAKVGDKIHYDLLYERKV